MEVSDQLHAPAALPPGKERRYPLDRRLGLDAMEKGNNSIIAPAGNWTPVVHPVA
jgi:hypothetical protein